MLQLDCVVVYPTNNHTFIISTFAIHSLVYYVWLCFSHTTTLSLYPRLPYIAKIDFKLKEPECIKKLQKSLARKRKYETSKKHSNRYKSDKRKLEKKYQKLANKKNDTSNKLCHELTSYNQVVIQDENLRGWKKSGHGKAVQHSILGRIKSKLKTMGNVTVLSRFAPTTKLCFHCGKVHKEIKLWDRVFKCDCGVSMDRDVHAAQCMVWMYQTAYKIPTEHRNTMQAENKTSGKYSVKKKAKSCSSKLEAHRL